MVNTIKYFVYIISCAVVVLVLSSAIQTSKSNDQTRATVLEFEWEKPVLVYFWNDDLGSRQDCDEVFAVREMIPNAETLGPGAVMELLNGVSASQIESGYSTAIPDGVLLQNFDIKNRIAYVDFSAGLSRASGSCRVRGIRAQIERTLLDLPDIDQVVLSVNGETEGILEP